MLFRVSKLFRGLRQVGQYRMCSEKYKISQEDIDIIKQLHEKRIRLEDVQDNINIKVEDVFKNREQLISFKLMNCVDIDSVFQLYSDELVKQLRQDNPEPQFNGNELSLFLYFTGQLRSEEYHDQMQQHSDRFNQILNRCLQMADQIEPQQFSAILWALATYKLEMGSMPLHDGQQYIIHQKLQIILEQLSVESLPSLAFAVNQILTNSRDILFQISNLISQNITHVPPENLVTLINCLPEGSFTNARPILDYLLESYEQDIVPNEQFAQIIMEVLRICHYNSNQFIDDAVTLFNTKLEENDKTTYLLSNFKIIDLILSFTQTSNGQFVNLTKKLIRILHGQSEKLNITDYVNLFLALPRIQLKISREIQLTKTVNILVELSAKSKIFQLRDFEPSEIIQVITACAALRYDNEKFIAALLAQLEIQSLNKSDLMTLAFSLIIYVRQFQEQYLRVHSVCAARKLQFSSIEQAQLMNVFSRIKIIIPDSPFFK